ncbi:MAG TPA: tRNA uridine-5-carboxymethylaminomethyl(34) synthesis GTPase MnmE [Caulobacteraceae bacterium]|jgi:tRNA modification GTPase
MNDTIFALATAPGRGAVAVVRLSGPASGEALDRLGGRRPPARQAGLRRLSGSDGARIDDALVLWLPGPASYTGEDSAEFHVHGGRAVVDALTEALMALGLRLAEPGEFTRRAFENGKLDLAQAEAVADLVDAETQAQRRQALGQLEGALGRRYEGWRASLVKALAWLEAEIDFPDEDVPGGLAARLKPDLERLVGELDEALADARRGERIRDGYRIAIVGAPNAGKSSLFNALVRREAAIVTAIPGTTRDVIEAVFDLGGFRVLLADTAGLRDSDDPVEAEGVRRARAWAEDAALRLWVVDGSCSTWNVGMEATRPGDLLILNKADCPRGEATRAAQAHADANGLDAVRVSASTGLGLEDLERRLGEAVAEALAGAEFPAATRARHMVQLEVARTQVGRALEALNGSAELAAEDLRLATRALERITGRIGAEDVLDLVFASFCIGK